jgi:glycosyltransferase involved in cell wall biosynthesis
MNRLLVNCSTLVQGGGIQVGISVVEHFIRSKKFDTFFILSSAISKQVTMASIDPKKIFITQTSPANPLSYKLKNQIKKIENDFKPQLVYSVGFPSYIHFQQIELGRYTNPWALVNHSAAFHQLNSFNKIKILLKARYRNFSARHALFFETQTNIAANGIERRLNINPENIKVIPNSINNLYFDSHKKVKKDNNLVKILYIAAPHIHKNIDIIPDVARELGILIPNKNFKFFVTLPKGSRHIEKLNRDANNKQVADQITNLGQLTVKECIDAYLESDIFFMPSLLEVFSASYLEAMQMSIPIVASDLDFAREACGTAALYFDPRSPKDAAINLQQLIENKGLRGSLISNGQSRLKEFPQNKLKFEILDQFISKIKKNKKI